MTSGLFICRGVIVVDFLGPIAKPFANVVALEKFDRICRTTGGTGGIAATKVALAGFVGLGQGVDRAKWTRDRAKMTTDTEIVEHHFGAGIGISGNRMNGARRHAPSFITLHAGVRGVAGFFVEHVDSYEALRRLKRPRLHK